MNRLDIVLKKITYTFACALAGVMLLTPALASAQADTGQLCKGADLQLDGTGNGCKTDNGSKSAGQKATDIVATVLNFISVVAGVVAVIMIIYGGFRFVTSAGNPENTKAARNTILFALVGLVIVAFAQVIVKFVLAKIS